MWAGNTAGGAASAGGGASAGGAAASTSGSPSGGSAGEGLAPAMGGAGGQAAGGTASGGAGGSGGQQAEPNAFAQASGSVELFVNGVSLGKSSADAALVSAAAALKEGAENVVALRATRGAATAPFALAELDGRFGRVGSSRQWKAKAASGVEATEAVGAWANTGYDDAAWASATDVSVAPQSPFPDGGPARGLWTATNTDATVLLRLRLYVPQGWAANQPYGFGRAVTGGDGGQVVRPKTRQELASALCGSSSGSTCTDTTPRVIELAGTIDFKGTEGTTTTTGCVVTQQCTAPTQSEYITNQQGACDGKAQLQVTLDTAGTTPLPIGSNKTLIGIGSSATLKGKGLRVRGGASNVIIRNITITDINPQVVWGGDAITLDDADKVWIDHNRFSLIARQMLVTGFGKASNTTVSWNEFDGQTPYAAYCDGQHYWVMLLLGAADTITMQGNWIHHTSGRAPHVGGYDSAHVTLHLLDNYFDQLNGHAVNPLTQQVRPLIEANYFRNVKTPILPDTTTAPAPGYGFAPIGTPSAATNSACTAALKRNCVTNVATPQGTTWLLDQPVLDTFSTVPADALVTPYPANQVPLSVPHLAGPGHL
jgi:pectate lyase